MDSFLKHINKNTTLTLLTLFLIAFSVRLYATPFDVVLRKDAVIYLMKSMEITRHDFSPILTHNSGWPLFMSPFLFLLGGKSVLGNMVYARMMSCLVGAACVIPLAYISREVLERKYYAIPLFLYAFSPYMVLSASTAYSEPLFTFMLLTSIYFIYKGRENRVYFMASSITASLAYYVRPTGIYVLAAVILSMLHHTRGKTRRGYMHVMCVILVFLLVSLPFLYQRHVFFGSPFYYGENSKYFVDDPEEKWSTNIPVPSIGEYLTTHTYSDYYDKFLINGLLNIILVFILMINPALLVFFPYGMIKHFNDARYTPIMIVFASWILGHTPAWSILGTMRHLWVLIPFIHIVSVAAIIDLVRRYRLLTTLLPVFLILFASISVSEVSGYRNQESKRVIDDGLEWSRWIAENVEGNLAVIDGMDLILMNSENMTIGGFTGGRYLYTSNRLNMTRPGYFNDFEPAMQWLEESGITHIVLDENNMGRRPYLREVNPAEGDTGYLTEVYSNQDTESAWKIRIYLINWSLYGENRGYSRV
ncbi:MAG: glycosyltransferase family 39 protein [Candidatus Altiarchaeota archaeon]